MGFKKYEGQGWRAGWIRGGDREEGRARREMWSDRTARANMDIKPRGSVMWEKKRSQRKEIKREQRGEGGYGINKPL